jgi:SAM-dependent methyltransferase
MKNGKTLDLGCGNQPRNPYGLEHVCGLDLYRPDRLEPSIDFRIANLTTQNLPFGTSELDVVSAFDVIEHIPRVWPTPDGETRFAFIEPMNEIWRVLKPGGIFYALTPAYPHPEAFQDPTHVNFITKETHLYFCGPTSYESNYGFKGQFECLRANWVHQKNAHTAEKTFRKSMRSFAKAVRFDGRKSHFLWELRAVK